MIKTKIFILLILLTFSGMAQDFSYDKKVGAEYSKQVEMMMGIYPDSALNKYLNAVGDRLVEVLGSPPVNFRFQVVDMAEPNAFALPGGYIYVSRGLLSLINEEDELAGVLGHEMIHVTKRHSVKQMKKSVWPGLLHIPGALVGVVSPGLGNAINTPISFGSELFLSNYSRKQESESDELGIRLASQAGYDPTKLAIILNNLSKDAELLTGDAEERSYFSSHPFTPKRMENIEEESSKLSWSKKEAIANDKISLYKKVDGMTYGPNPAQGIFDSSYFKHPDLNLSITFPENWNTVNVPVAVGAMQPEGEAQLVFMVEESGNDPDSLGIAFAEKLQKEFDITPTKNTSLTINGFPAYLVSAIDVSGKEPVEFQVYYIKTEKVLFNAIGMCYLKHSKIINQTVKSTRPLTSDEKKEFTINKIRGATAINNESLKDFSKRTNNQWNIETTSLKNGIKSGGTLQEGQILKILAEESYFSY